MKPSKPYEVLAIYEPPRISPVWPWWKAWRVGQDLTSLTAKHGLRPHKDPKHGPLDVSWSDTTLHAEVRRTTTFGKGGDEWHQDGDTTPGSNMACGLVTWASSHPTLLRDKAGVVYQPLPFQVILFNNLVVWHRRPDDAPKYRFLFRQRVELA